MHQFLKNRKNIVGCLMMSAVLPLTGCTTVETTAFTPILLPNGCTIGNNCPACKNLNTNCATPITIKSDYYGDSDSDQRHRTQHGTLIGLGLQFDQLKPV